MNNLLGYIRMRRHTLADAMDTSIITQCKSLSCVLIELLSVLPVNMMMHISCIVISEAVKRFLFCYCFLKGKKMYANLVKKYIFLVKRTEGKVEI